MSGFCFRLKVPKQGKDAKYALVGVLTLFRICRKCFNSYVYTSLIVANTVADCFAHTVQCFYHRYYFLKRTCSCDYIVSQGFETRRYKQDSYTTIYWVRRYSAIHMLFRLLVRKCPMIFYRRAISKDFAQLGMHLPSS